MKLEKARTTVRIVETDCASSSISRIGDRTAVSGSASSKCRMRSVSVASALIERAMIEPSPQTSGSVATTNASAKATSCQRWASISEKNSSRGAMTAMRSLAEPALLIGLNAAT